MNSNVCLGCRFGSVRVEILAPEECDAEDFVKQTKQFLTQITALTCEKQIHYSLIINSSQKAEELSFNVQCNCILNIKKKDCSRFNLTNNHDCRVTHLQHIIKLAGRDFTTVETGLNWKIHLYNRARMALYSGMLADPYMSVVSLLAANVIGEKATIPA
jgi:restriction endonuclease